MPRYGVTQWGEAFIDAMENLADGGRLARGKTYANTGRAKDIKINKFSVSAKVQGSSKRPYNVVIKFLPFKKVDIEKIVQVIQDNPLVLAQILNGKLPKEVLTLLKEKNISLLPSSWEEMSRSCSCPDWGDPCKHMASVYYLLTSNIDKNPFVLFELRGVDLTEYFSIVKNIEVPYPLTLNRISKKDIDDIEDNNEKVEPFNMNAFEDFSHFILSLLTPNPIFSDINYKDVLQEFYKKSKKQLAIIVSPIQSENIPKIARVLQDATFELNVNKEVYGSSFTISSSLLKNADVQELFKPFISSLEDESVTISPMQLFKLFISFEDENGSKSYRYLFFLYRVIYMLIHNNGLLPNVLEVSNGFYVSTK